MSHANSCWPTLAQIRSKAHVGSCKLGVGTCWILEALARLGFPSSILRFVSPQPCFGGG
jgi:hypothetical protein